MAAETSAAIPRSFCRAIALCAAALLLTGAKAQELPDLIERYERFAEAYPMEAGRSDPARSREGWPDETPAGMAHRRAELQRIAAAHQLHVAMLRYTGAAFMPPSGFNWLPITIGPGTGVAAS